MAEGAVLCHMRSEVRAICGDAHLGDWLVRNGSSSVNHLCCLFLYGEKYFLVYFQLLLTYSIILISGIQNSDSTFIYLVISAISQVIICHCA